MNGVENRRISLLFWNIPELKNSRWPEYVYWRYISRRIRIIVSLRKRDYVSGQLQSKEIRNNISGLPYLKGRGLWEWKSWASIPAWKSSQWSLSLCQSLRFLLRRHCFRRWRFLLQQPPRSLAHWRHKHWQTCGDCQDCPQHRSLLCRKGSWTWHKKCELWYVLARTVETTLELE